jgi:hypothetical protein
MPRSFGSTGPAPNTVWFGNIPDRLNMLRPGLPSQNLFPGVYRGWYAANFLNLWFLNNLQYNGGSNVPTASLGGFTTAPDGTNNTAQLLVETTANTQHQTWCEMEIRAGIGPTRLSGFFKSTNRRLKLMLIGDPQVDTITTHLPFGGNGMSAVFDLVGGQVGVGATVIGTGIPIGVEMVPYPNGWFKCSLDLANAGGTELWAAAIIDHGTGTNAESVTYAGDGASGVYGWRTNCMPIPAYALNNVCFFDDFTDHTLSNIDLANTHDPAKTWFLQHSVPFIPYASIGPQPPNGASGDNTSFQQSGSILTILGGHNGANVPQLHTFAANSNDLRTVNPAPYIGKGWVPPALFESSLGFHFAEHAGTEPTGAFWTWSIENVVGNPFSQPFTSGFNGNTQNFNLTGKEIDFFEDARPRAASILNYEEALGGSSIQVVGNIPMAIGSPPWNNTHIFFEGDSCFYVPNSTFYIALDTNTNKIPPDTLGVHWKLYTDLSAPNFAFQSNQPPVLNDPALQNVYSILIIPYKPGQVGLIMGFYNGIYTQTGPIITWSPNGGVSGNGGSGYSFKSNDWQQLPIILNAGNVMTYDVDWVKVTQ